MRPAAVSWLFSRFRANNQLACPLARGTSDSGRRSRCRSLMSGRGPGTKGCTAPLAAGCAGSLRFREDHAGRFRRRGAGDDAGLRRHRAGRVKRRGAGGWGYSPRASRGPIRHPYRTASPAANGRVCEPSPGLLPLARGRQPCECYVIKSSYPHRSFGKKGKAHKEVNKTSLCAFACIHKATTPLQG